mgnify:CR=1 FL=1
MNRLILAITALCFAYLQSCYVASAQQQSDSLKVSLEAHPQADTTRVKILNDLTWILRASDPTRAMQYGQEALEIGQRLGFKQGLVKTYSFMGVCARNLNNYGLAAEMYLKHLLVAEELDSPSEIFFAVNNIGNLYINQEDWTNALKYLQRNLEYAERQGTVEQKAYAYVNLGRSYSGLQEYGKAMQFFEKALPLQLQRRDTARIVSILNEIANIHFLRNDDAKALQAHQRLIEMASMTEDRNLPKSFVQIAIIYQRRGMRDSSDWYAHRSEEMSLKVGRAETRATALRVLSENAALSGEFERAYRVHVVYAAVRDSLLQSKGVKELSSLQARYEVEKKQREIESLGNESRVQQTTRNIFIGGFLVALVFIGLIGYRYREKFRTEAIIRQQNENLQAQAVEISTINELLSKANTTLQEGNETLQHKNDQLAALNAEKNELMGIVSHDLKNPIAAVRTFAELIDNQTFTGDEVFTATRQIVQTSDRMLELVKNLLDINRLESGGMQMNPVTFDIAPMVEAATWQYQSQAESKNITLSFSNQAEDSTTRTDEQALMQVLDNLISNAVKYSPHEKNIFIRLTSNEAAVQIEVQDEGPGISEEDMKKLFGKFARLTARPTGGEHSTGLGLSIVKKMVEMMNGRVWCESEYSKGATFIVALPIALHQPADDDVSPTL